jgi:hypothetical protein
MSDAGIETEKGIKERGGIMRAGRAGIKNVGGENSPKKEVARNWAWEPGGMVAKNRMNLVLCVA